MALTLGLTLGFRSSDNLAAAFGIAVSLTMLLTSVLMFLAMREVWGWSLPLSVAVAGLFVVVDLSFVAANLMKVLEGGWVPLVVAARASSSPCHLAASAARALLRKLERDTLPLEDFIAQVHNKARVPGTAVYLTSRIDVVPVPLLHNLKHNKVLHQRIVLLHVADRQHPARSPRQAPRGHPSRRRFPRDRRPLRLHAASERARRCSSCAARSELKFNMMEPRFSSAGSRSCRHGARARPHPLQAVRGDASQRAGGDRILPHPAEPRDRTRRPDRALGSTEADREQGHSAGSLFWSLAKSTKAGQLAAVPAATVASNAAKRCCSLAISSFGRCPAQPAVTRRARSRSPAQCRHAG